jgi:hypothetical protein
MMAGDTACGGLRMALQHDPRHGLGAHVGAGGHQRPVKTARFPAILSLPIWRQDLPRLVTFKRAALTRRMNASGLGRRVSGRSAASRQSLY